MRAEERIVVVTGGRTFSDAGAVEASLDRLAPGVIYHGACRGADWLADTYARKHGITVRRFPANWRHFGASAGPRRNRTMVTAACEAGSAVMLAFPGGRGTAHAVKVAAEAWLPVFRWEPFGQCLKCGNSTLACSEPTFPMRLRCTNCGAELAGGPTGRGSLLGPASAITFLR